MAPPPFSLIRYSTAGNRLLVGRGARVEDVVRRLLAFVLDRVEEQAVQLLEDREHGLSRHRSPAAEDDGHPVLLQELARLLGEERPVRRRVDDDRLELLAEHAALRVDLVDGHQRDVAQRRLADRHRARQRVQNADLDRVAGRRGRGGRRRPRALAAAVARLAAGAASRASSLLHPARSPAGRRPPATMSHFRMSLSGNSSVSRNCHLRLFPASCRRR